MAQGVFSLLEVRAEQVKNIANGNFASWSESRSRGYFTGGSSVSVITKVDFSTDVVDRMITGYPQVRYNLATVSSNLYGYSGGGQTPGGGGTGAITRLDFANETFSDPGKNFPTGVRYNLASVSSSSYGYFSGGNEPGVTSRIDRLDFTNETISNPTNLITARATHAGFSNDLYGYFAGNVISSPPTSNIIERLDFSLETTSNPGKNLPYNAADLVATSSSSYGYFAGSSAPGSTALSNIERFDFSNETPSKVNNNLPTTRSNLAAISSDSFGYFGGGTDPTAGFPPALSSVHRFDFNNETIKKLDYDLSNNTTNLSGIYGARSVLRKAGFRTYGYFAGGTDPGPTPNVTSAMSRLDFSTESVSSPNTLNDTTRRIASIASNNYGYFAYGTSPIANRLDFSNDSTLTISSLSSPSSGRLDASGFSSNSYGYFGGGQLPPLFSSAVVNTISRFDFSSETVSDPGKNLSVARNSMATISNSSYGYFGGGDIGGATQESLLSRLDFSNEVVTNLTPLSAGRQDFSAGSNYLYGYFFAGQTTGTPPSIPVNTSAIIRLDFSNDTASNISPRFPNARQNHTTVSADSYSYSGGGNVSPGIISTITRFNFNTETASNISNTLPQTLGVENLGSVTNSN